MSTFIFAVQPAIGHLNPMASIARQLQGEGHEIIFVCFAPEVIEKHVEANGFRLQGIPGIKPSLFKLVTFFMTLPSGYPEIFNATKIMFGRLTFIARKFGRVLDEIRPDMVVSDFTFPGACLAAEMKDTPYVTIYHAGLCFKGPGIPPFGSGLPIGEAWGRKGRLYKRLSGLLEKNIESTVGRARRRLGLPPSENNFLTLSPWLTLVLTAEAMEAPRFALPPTVFFIGPCLTGRRNLPHEEDFPFDRLSRDKPRIYVSLGTFFNNRPRVFNKIISAFSDGRFQLIVKAGRAFARLSSQRNPSNVLLFRNVPQLDVIPRVDAVISHGGNNTVNETLSAGKPLLVMPVGGEQGDNAARVEYLGVGLRADIERSTAQEIRMKLTRLIEEPTFRQRAKEVARSLAKTEGPPTAARFITHISQTRQPLFRPEGYPLTVTRKAPPPWEFVAD